jgi:site-specific DNA recombinase
MRDNSAKPKNAPIAKNVGIWIRVSSEDQAKGESPAHHLERAKAYAMARGWSVKEVYDLAGISGKSVKEHPECKRMEADVKRGHITGLIFSKLARLARNTKELLGFSDDFRDYNADLISISETIDTSTPAGRLFFTIIAAMATWEREEIADRQKASILVRAKLGKTINGRAPYGYQWKDRRLVVQPDEAPVRRKAYELFTQYQRKGTVAKLLNAAGHRSREHKMFRDCNVERMLTCSSAKGVYYFNRIRKNGPWKGTEKPEEEWGEAKCEAIVPEEQWNQVNKIIEEQLKQWKRPGKMPVNPFGNRLWCQCGGKMYERKHIGKFHCRACNRKIPVELFEQTMREELHQFYGAPQQVALHMENAKKNLITNEQALASLQRQIQKVRDEMKETYQLFLEKHITPQGFGEFYKPAEERLNQLLSELPRLEAEVSRLKVQEVSAEEVIYSAKTLYEQWPKLDSERKRAMVEAAFERIEFLDGKLRIRYSGIPTSEELCKNQQQMAPALC